MRLLAVFMLLGFHACVAAAAPIVNIKSLSPAGHQAIMTFDRIWAIVDLGANRTVQALRPPKGCVWTSMSYAHQSDDIAMVAYCSAPQQQCEDGGSLLLISRAGAPPLQVAERRGARWTGAVWQAEGQRIHLLETEITRPIAMGLDDLNANVRRCGWAKAAMKVVDIETGASISLNVLPDLWSPRGVILATGNALTATIAARVDPAGVSPAAKVIQQICADPRDPAQALRAVCKPGGYDLVMTWTDGEWVLGAGDWTGAEAFHGRAVASPVKQTVAREDCEIVLTSASYSLKCALSVSRDGRITQITAPKGLFGDLALSGDGRFLATVTAGRSVRYRRFDLWDLDTGAVTSLDPILTPETYFDKWPPR